MWVGIPGCTFKVLCKQGIRIYKCCICLLGKSPITLNGLQVNWLCIRFPYACWIHRDRHSLLRLCTIIAKTVSKILPRQMFMWVSEITNTHISFRHYFYYNENRMRWYKKAAWRNPRRLHRKILLFMVKVY